MHERQPFTEHELQDLVRKAQEGDQDAFTKVYDQFFQGIYRYAAFRLPAEIAEDVTADIFVKVWEKLHTYTFRANVPFGAWIYRIARHSVIDAYRTHRPTEEVSEMIEDPDQLNRADSRTGRADRLHMVRTALHQLPKRYREVLLLTFISDLPNAEAARVLKISEGSLRILKMRALRKLEGFLPPEAADPA
jgi:RNA polymerase sigma-70 factor, ECF subfamily